MVRIDNLFLSPVYSEADLKSAIAKSLKISVDGILEYKIIKKSIDARKKNDIKYCISVCAALNNEQVLIRKKHLTVFVEKQSCMPKKSVSSSFRPVVCGFGPAGMFASLFLAYAGLKPIVIERGGTVDERMTANSEFISTGKLNTKTNIQFGEGGAGTFSDGKLTTNIKDPRIYTVLKELYDCGAPEEILYLSKPHLGTDNLCKIVKNIRKKVVSMGGEIRFNTCLTDLILQNNRIIGIETDKGSIETDRLIICAGHSARDVFEILKKHNASMEQKPFSIGVRIEHKQDAISYAQYGEFYKVLPPADYKLVNHLDNGRSVYSFCMCPGGTVVAAASEENRLVVNGMSNFSRNGQNANAAILCSVTPDDFESDDILSGIDFQQKYEESAFKLGGGNYVAPAQLVGDFLSDKPSSQCGSVVPSYPIGVKWGSIKECLPDFAVDSIKKSLPEFDKKINGFATADAVLTGVETRSSSPVRVLRDDKYTSSILGVYPCGEGAGYAGGITSAAVDGLRVAEQIYKELL